MIEFPLESQGYSIRMTAKPIVPGQYMWAVRRNGEILFHRTREELETRLSKSLKPTLLNEQRANLLGLLNSRVVTLSAGVTHRTATGRFSSGSPTPMSLPNPHRKMNEWLKDIIHSAASTSNNAELSQRERLIKQIKERALAAHQPSVGDILAEKKITNDTYRKEEVAAVLVDLKRQRDHFLKLGKDKPADHEYNLTGHGYSRLVQEWSALDPYLATKKRT